MDDALLVRRLQRLGDLPRVSSGRLERERPGERRAPSTSSITSAPCSTP